VNDSNPTSSGPSDEFEPVHCTHYIRGKNRKKVFWRAEVKDTYETGVEQARADAKIVMSMAYERHAEDIDRMFELYFSKGYEHCWKRHR
jgi:hypothetical protein